MRKAIIFGLALCLLSAVPATASLMPLTDWQINLSAVAPSMAGYGVLTVPDVQWLDYQAPSVLRLQTVARFRCRGPRRSLTGCSF